MISTGEPSQKIHIPHPQGEIEWGGARQVWKMLVFVLSPMLILVTGCAAGKILDRPNSDSATFARINNHVRDERAETSSSLPDYPYADVNWVWPLWSYEDASDSKSFLDHRDILLTDGWFYIEYTCPNVIYVDSYGIETVVHVKAGHIYKIVCRKKGEYGSLEDQGISRTD